jgi:hypothetical protein
MSTVHPFAMILDVTPAEKADAFAETVRAARPEEGIKVEVRTPSLFMFQVTAEVEFLAIDQAMEWLKGLAAKSEPPVTLNLNAQPAHEVESVF